MYHIHEADKDELGAIDLDMSKAGKKGNSSSCKNGNTDEEFWWNRVNLTVLDLSSNALKSISGDIKNLSDLVTLNVSRRIIIIAISKITLFCSYTIML